MTTETLFLLFTGVLAGIVNAIAGGGSLISFPALVISGLSPLVANATNTLSAVFSYISGTIALRQHLFTTKKQIWFFTLISLIGGYLGAELLLFVSNAGFKTILPYLILFATLLFAFGKQINLLIKKFPHPKSLQVFSIFSALLVCIYGGFFNAGLGILLMVYLVLFNNFKIATINALKLYMSVMIAIFALFRFGMDGILAYHEGLIVGIGAGMGGYLGGHLSKKIDERYIKILVVIIGLFLSGYYFIV